MISSLTEVYFLGFSWCLKDRHDVYYLELNKHDVYLEVLNKHDVYLEVLNKHACLCRTSK